MIPKATNEPAPIGISRMRGEPTNPSSTSKIPSATSAEGKGSSAPEMGVAASCVARASGALIAGAARMERLLLSGACLCAGAAWNADADSTAQSTSKDLIVDMAVDCGVITNDRDVHLDMRAEWCMDCGVKTNQP